MLSVVHMITKQKIPNHNTSPLFTPPCSCLLQDVSQTPTRALILFIIGPVLGGYERPARPIRPSAHHHPSPLPHPAACAANLALSVSRGIAVHSPATLPPFPVYPTWR